MSGIELIVKEREKQIQHGYNAEYDKRYEEGGLILLAEFLMKPDDDAEKDNISHELVTNHGFQSWYIHKLWLLSRKEQLIKAAALIAAEIDRIDPDSAKVPYVQSNDDSGVLTYVNVLNKHDFKCVNPYDYMNGDMRVLLGGYAGSYPSNEWFVIVTTPDHPKGIRYNTPEELNMFISKRLPSGNDKWSVKRVIK